MTALAATPPCVAMGNHRRLGLAAGAALALAVLSSSSAGASCQSAVCQQQYLQSEEKRLQEALAKAQDGGTIAWSAIDRLLAHTARRQRSMAGYRAQLDWAPQPVIDRWPEAQDQAVEVWRAWRERWRAAEPSSAAAWCEGESPSGLAAPVLADLETQQRLYPESVGLLACLIQLLGGAGRNDEALALARGLTQSHPDDPQSWAVLARAAERAGDRSSQLAAIEQRGRRFAAEPWHQYEALQALRTAGAEAERDRLYADLSAAARSPEDRRRLCVAFDGRDPRYDDCQRAVLAADPGSERSAADEGAIRSARQALLMSAIHAKDLVEVERLVLATPPQEAASGWSAAVDWLKQPACPAMLRDLASGRFTPLSQGDPEQTRAVEVLMWPLRTCEATATAHELLDALGAGGRGLSVDERLRILRQQRTETRLAATPTDRAAQFDLDNQSQGRPAGERIGYLMNRLAQGAPGPQLRHYLLDALAEHAAQGHQDEAFAAAQRSLTLFPDDRDWALQIAFLDARWHEDAAAAALAERVLADPAATPRQRAESDFVLARVDRRAGRFAAASARLERYFLTRLRYEGCASHLECDAVIGLDLAEAFDDQRRASYLRKRYEALSYYRNVIAFNWRDDRKPCWIEAHWPATLPRQGAAPTCRQPHTLERLRAEPAGAGRQERIAAAERLPECSGAADAFELALDAAKAERVWVSLTEVN